MNPILVRHTRISLIQPGDFLLFKARGLDKGDFLGEIIAHFEGGNARYTHAASIRDVPDPETVVSEIRPGVFKVYEKAWLENFSYDSCFEGETKVGTIKKNTMGIKLEATWPKCREWAIDWENENMEVWRVRFLTPQNIEDILRMQQDMVGVGPLDDLGNHADAWDYNVAEFLTFGLLNQASAKICSQFVADPVYNSTLIRGCLVGNFPIALTPDLLGNRDQEKTPNDLALSGFAYRINHQGLI